jgi:hypothetical protein
MIIIFFLASCSNKSLVNNSRFDENNITISAKNFSFPAGKMPQFDVKFTHNNGSRKLINSNLLIIEQSGKKENIYFRIKKLRNKNGFTVEPKSKLEAGKLYGLYWQKSEGEWELKLLFAIHDESPKLLFHDLPKGEEVLVQTKRRHFTFYFDKPIMLLDKKTITLINQRGESIPFQDIQLKLDHSLELILAEKSELSSKETYLLSLKGLTGRDNSPVADIEIKFKADVQSTPTKNLTEPEIRIAYNGILISQKAGQAHRNAFYFGMEGKKHDCLQKSCPIVVESTELAQHHLSRLFVPLKPNTGPYHIIMKESDKISSNIISGGTIKLKENPKIMFSEIFNNPKSREESKQEFVEFYNAGESIISIKNSELLLMDKNHKKKDRLCRLPEAKISPKSYFLLVGQDFDASAFVLAPDLAIVRLEQKSLCGGLSNNNEQNIAFISDKGELFDYYGVMLNAAPLGMSIGRKNILGLDEATNYCYSKSDKGPSPGSRNCS